MDNFQRDICMLETLRRVIVAVAICPVRYDNWLPDLKGDMDSLTKFTYYIGIKESNVTGRSSALALI